jgi:putative MFS transporter
VSEPAGSQRAIWLAILVAALGYFVDIFDLVLFGVVRKASLLDLGVAADQIGHVGELLINCQMTGMLVGGVLFGVLGDRHGRLSVLFGSIVTYSLANIANGFVESIPAYATWRFIAGVGLAGELGAGITLVSELMSKETRGIGTTIVAAVGLLGALAASLVGSTQHLDWRHAYFIGGGLGLALLVLRVSVAESGLFARVRGTHGVTRGNFLALFSSRKRLGPYLRVIAIGIPIWYVVGLLVFFSPELGTALGMTPPPVAADAIFWCYAGLSVGDLCSGLLSQRLKSRKRAVALFLGLMVVAVVYYFTVGPRSVLAFKIGCFLCGLGSGYWAVFVTMAAEQFGTNLRATVTTSAPNFVRGTVPLLMIAYELLRDAPIVSSAEATRGFGPVGAAVAVGVGVLTLAFLMLAGLRETYARDLDFVEH